MAIRNFSDNAPPQALVTALTSSSSNTAVVVGSTNNYPTPPFILGLERGTLNQEVCLCTSVTNITTFAVTRGYDGTPVVAHSIGATVEHTSAAIDYREANSFVNTINTKGDILVYGNSGAARLGVGTDGTFLMSDSSQTTGLGWDSIFSPGMVMWTGAGAAPNGWFFAQGQAVSRAVYNHLFSAISTTFGSGDGATTFNIPFVQGRTLVGAGTTPGLTSRSLGQVFGEEAHVITREEGPNHIHQVPANMTIWDDPSTLYVAPLGSFVGTAGVIPVTATGGTEGAGNELTGVANTGGVDWTYPPQPHNNIQPSLVLNAIIKY